MFLKSLSMKGFKSFADTTVLQFEPGITVVVGPNGSGKSNVVDAVTWVLGAQGPRALRSAKMEDVIFAGTSSRPALGRAEVSLTIDNSSGRLPVDMAEVTITRTLFRTGDSEYAINGTPCRLLDIQDLLNDSGVGRSQHMIIGQGQLDAVLNARPEDRRAVIEEAAGVLKHRRRRERAERRLETTRENLERLGDLVREVKRQIRPLERQAAAARSHATLAGELEALRAHLSGAELGRLTERREAATAELSGRSEEEAVLRRTLAELDEQVTEAAAQLTSQRHEDLATALGRVQGLVERTRGTAGVLRERSRSLTAALDAAADVDVVSTLEAEGARLGAELAGAEEEDEALGPERQALQAEADRLAADQAALAERFGDGGEAAAADEALGAARVRRELLTRARGEAERGAQALARRAEALAAAAQAAGAALAEAERGAGQAREERAGTETARQAAEAAERSARTEAETARQAADAARADRARAEARAEALARALQELEGTSGRRVLDGRAGVVGALADLVVIDPGYEIAFQAAAGAALAGVVVAGRAEARDALDLLRRAQVTGAVLAAPDAGAPGAVILPPAGEALRHHVRGRGGRDVEAVLDRLVGPAVVVDSVESAVDLALEHPDLVVVTREGDRLARSGWQVRSGTSAVTAAAVEQAEARAAQARDGAGRAEEREQATRAAHEAARGALAEAVRRADRAVAAEREAGAETARAGAEVERLGEEAARLAAEAEGGTTRGAQLEAELEELAGAMGDLEATAAAARDRAARRAEAVRALDERRKVLEETRRALAVRQAEVDERRRVLTGRRAEVERRLEGHAEERAEAEARRRRLEEEGRALQRLSALVERERARLDQLHDALRRDYRTQVEAVRAGGERLERLRGERGAAERRLGEVRDRMGALELELGEVEVRSEAVAEAARRELGRDPEELVGSPCPELPEGVSPDDRAEELAAKLARLGPVNPLALEELSTLEARHHELEGQVDDVRSARRELQEVIRTLDQEIVETFAAAAADVNEHFSALVEMLFPGGQGRMTLTDPEDLLNTGVEIEVRPMGRNVRRVSLLSGGERSLAALAFLFAVFRSRPSPFYLMDEVEAALDDVNLHRFLGLVHEFREEAQLIIVSHQKRTMESGDALYGVTMAPGGSSQVVSQKVSRPEAVEQGAA
jgi:chromosome segregation protein